ncbi:DUF1292 domain-containing protein [Intestinibacillus sp. Marseille-P6563]|uniref:DUF1292 domain-containing protein n=1 Tax=Intestinibacillus sp. Marseille-P6563 TaxID=2364792 RepID=UPI000F048801|nr:DUF1292 domain-containing protein [Intestinibacillus sp. Marseille-P6563]
MSEAFGNDYVVLTDEDGNEVEFQHIDTVEVDGQTYMAFIPAELAVDEEAEVVILKVVEENGEEILATVEDDDEADKIFDIVMERVEDMYEDEE